MWVATGTHLAPKTLYQWRKHHNMQTLSAVSCQRSAVSCRSFCSRVHAFGTSPALLKPPYLYAFSATEATSTTTTTTHPITMYHTHHRPCSTTTYIRHPLCIRSASINTLFLRSHTTIYQTHAPFLRLHSHHCLHAFSARPQIALFARFSLTVHTLHTPLKSGSNCFGHPTTSMWMATCTHLAPKTLDQWRKHHNMQTLSAVSCQLSAVVQFAQGSTPLERLQHS